METNRILPPGPPNEWPQRKTWEQRGNVPHAVILGAGASKAACPSGDKNGRILPLMNELFDVVLNRRRIAPDARVSARQSFEGWFCDLSDDARTDV